jgi:hypothetical protein
VQNGHSSRIMQWKFIFGLFFFFAVVALLYLACDFTYQPFNARIKSLRATLPAEVFLLGIVNSKGLTGRRLYKSFGVKGLTNYTALWQRNMGYQEVRYDSPRSCRDTLSKKC